MTSLENKRKDSMKRAGERAAKIRNKLREKQKTKLMIDARRETENIDKNIKLSETRKKCSGYFHVKHVLFCSII